MDQAALAAGVVDVSLFSPRNSIKRGFARDFASEQVDGSGAAGASSSSTGSTPADEAAGLGEAAGLPPPAPSAAAQSAAAATAGDLSHFQQYIVRNGRYWDVRDQNGKVLGRIQPMSGMLGYKAVAKCLCDGHTKDCARMRAWKMNTGEPPNQVDLVLAEWLHKGPRHQTSAKHMGEPRP